MRPRISPAWSVKETSANSPARLAPRTSSTAGVGLTRPGRHRVLDALAGHQLGEPVVVDLGCGKGADLAAVAQHGHPLGDLDHLLEPMADEDDGDAVRLQPANRREQQVDLVPGQRGRRLVHEQDAGIGGEPAADRDDLALRDRQRCRRGASSGRSASSRASAACAAVAHRLARRRPERRAELQVDGDVLHDRQVRETATGPGR